MRESDVYVVGIDPGKAGALVGISRDGKIVESKPMPEFMHEVYETLREWAPQMVYLEKAQAMPKQGVSSVFTYGDHFGQLQGILISLGIPYQLVTPQAWQKTMFAGTATTLKPKKRALIAATRLYPHQDWRAHEGCRVAHDGIVDAALLATYAWRSHRGAQAAS